MIPIEIAAIVAGIGVALAATYAEHIGFKRGVSMTLEQSIELSYRVLDQLMHDGVSHLQVERAINEVQRAMTREQKGHPS